MEHFNVGKLTIPLVNGVSFECEVQLCDVLEGQDFLTVRVVSPWRYTGNGVVEQQEPNKTEDIGKPPYTDITTYYSTMYKDADGKRHTGPVPYSAMWYAKKGKEAVERGLI